MSLPVDLEIGKGFNHEKIIDLRKDTAYWIPLDGNTCSPNYYMLISARKAKIMAIIIGRSLNLVDAGTGNLLCHWTQLPAYEYDSGREAWFSFDDKTLYLTYTTYRQESTLCTCAVSKWLLDNGRDCKVRAYEISDASDSSIPRLGPVILANTSDRFVLFSAGGGRYFDSMGKSEDEWWRRSRDAYTIRMNYGNGVALGGKITCGCFNKDDSELVLAEEHGIVCCHKDNNADGEVLYSSKNARRIAWGLDRVLSMKWIGDSVYLCYLTGLAVFKFGSDGVKYRLILAPAESVTACRFVYIERIDAMVFLAMTKALRWVEMDTIDLHNSGIITEISKETVLDHLAYMPQYRDFAVAADGLSIHTIDKAGSKYHVHSFIDVEDLFGHIKNAANTS
jgi:hypothetical protein